MTRRNARVCLQDIRDHAAEALGLTRGKNRTDLDTNRLLNLALVRLLEIVGEAASSVPDDVRQQYPQVPWKQLVGLRNRLIHAYHQVDLDILWKIVSQDLPPLVARLDEILAHAGP